jgi:hypothetical protein
VGDVLERAADAQHGFGADVEREEAPAHPPFDSWTAWSPMSMQRRPRRNTAAAGVEVPVLDGVTGQRRAARLRTGRGAGAARRPGVLAIGTTR